MYYISCPEFRTRRRKTKVCHVARRVAAIFEWRTSAVAWPIITETASPRGRGKTAREGVGGRVVEARQRGGSTCEPQAPHPSPGGESHSLPLLLVPPNLVILGFLRKSFISQARRPGTRASLRQRPTGTSAYISAPRARSPISPFINIRKRSSIDDIFGLRARLRRAAPLPSLFSFLEDAEGTLDLSSYVWKMANKWALG